MDGVPEEDTGTGSLPAKGSPLAGQEGKVPSDRVIGGIAFVKFETWLAAYCLNKGALWKNFEMVEATALQWSEGLSG